MVHSSLWESTKVDHTCAMGHTLRDPELDRLLERDGFIVVPLDGIDTDSLRKGYEQLGNPVSSGFVPDLTIADPDYRRRGDALIAEHTAKAVLPEFPNHEPFMHSFLCKHPGPDSALYLHQDWMYVDERHGGNTFVAWVAVDDVTGHNGQLRALRGSHKMDGSLRGTDATAHWLEHTDVIEPHLVSIPVRAGDMVVMNNALVHSSFPNNTDRFRLAAATGMRPKGEKLAYFRRIDETSVARYEVEPEFFQTHTPQELFGTPPDLPIAEIIHEPVSDRTPEQLEADLMQLRDAGFTMLQRLRRRFGRRFEHSPTA